MDLKAQQDGFETGVPTYNKEKSTLESTSGKSLNELNLNHAQRLVLISNNSDNPEVHPEKLGNQKQKQKTYLLIQNVNLIQT